MHLLFVVANLVAGTQKSASLHGHGHLLFPYLYGMRNILPAFLIICCCSGCFKNSGGGSAPYGISGNYYWSGTDTIVGRDTNYQWVTSVKVLNDTFTITDLNSTQLYANYYMPTHMFDGEVIADTMTLVSDNKITNTLIYQTLAGARYYQYFTSPAGSIDTVAFEVLTVMRNQHMMYYDSYQTDHYGDVWNVHLSAKMQ